MPKNSKPRNDNKDGTVSFQKFQEGFLHEVRLPYFGDEGDSGEDYRSPAAKELEKTGAIKILSKVGFLRFAHKSLRSCNRLVKEQGKVRQVSAEMGCSIRRLRDTRKTLKGLREQIKGLDKRLVNVLSDERRMHFYNALRELELVEGALFGIETTKAWHIHPEKRKKHDSTVGKGLKFALGWKPLLPHFDYELDSLKKKAPEHWLIETLDLGLQRRFKQAKIKVSIVTRYRIVTEILASGGLPITSAATIKQHFNDKKKHNQSLARNSQAT
jgi:hypothetical protein